MPSRLCSIRCQHTKWKLRLLHIIFIRERILSIAHFSYSFIFVSLSLDRFCTLRKRVTIRRNRIIETNIFSSFIAVCQVFAYGFTSFGRLKTKVKLKINSKTKFIPVNRLYFSDDHNNNNDTKKSWFVGTGKFCYTILWHAVLVAVKRDAESSFSHWRPANTPILHQTNDEMVNS